MRLCGGHFSQFFYYVLHTMINCYVYFALYVVVVCFFSVNYILINFYSHCNLAANCNSLTYGVKASDFGILLS